MKKESKRNMVAQHIKLPDGSSKTIFHQKAWPVMSRKEAWAIENKTAKPKSKRQLALATKAKINN